MPKRLGTKAKGLLRIVIYPIIFADDPLGHVARVAEMVAGEARPQSYAPAERFVAAIDEGLASSDDLARLLPQPHTDAVIRRFLAALRIRLASSSPSP